MKKIILHSDINNCYASIEVKEHPEWDNKPLIVCGNVKNRHGIVLAKSEIAKTYGVKTGETVWETEQKCPNLIKTAPNYEKYLFTYYKMLQIYNQFTNQVEAFGLDEAWLDITGSIHLFGSVEKLVTQLHEKIYDELGLTVSIGVSFNKIFAKLGSDLKKTNGTTYIPKEHYKAIIGDLPVDSIIGIGPATKRHLNQMGIFTLSQLATTSIYTLKKEFGIQGEKIWLYANGKDCSPVSEINKKSPIKSIGKGWTIVRDIKKNKEIRKVIFSLCEEVSNRLREASLMTLGISIHIRYEDLSSESFQKKLNRPIFLCKELFLESWHLLNDKYTREKSIRAFTIRAINLVPYIEIFQLDCFLDYKNFMRQKRLEDYIYNIRNRWGSKSITYAHLLENDLIPEYQTDVLTLPIAVERNKLIKNKYREKISSLYIH